MTVRSKYPRRLTIDLASGWIRSNEVTVNGRQVTVGTELSIKGEPGARFRFKEHVVTPGGNEHITVYGGTKGQGQWRSFALDQVKTVHRVDKLR